MNFSVKLTALFSGIFLVIGSITSYLVYTSNLKILESQIKDKLEVQAFHTIDKIDRMLFERFTDIKVIATDPVISSRNSTPKQIRERLIAYRNNYRSYVSLSFFDLNRVMITDTIGIDIGKQHPRITYWLDIAGGKEFVFDVSKSIPLGFSVFHFAMVVKDKNGSPFGVVVIRMPVEKLYDITKRTFGMDQAVEQDFKIDLVNKEGLLIYSNYNRKGILNEIMPDWENLKRFLKSGKKTGSFRHHYLGEDVIHVFALEQGYLDFIGGDWTFIIHAPTKVIFAPAIELRNRVIIVLLVFGFLALFIIFLFSHTMTRPLAKLNDASIEIGKGNLDAKVEISSKDEIGQLGVSFNKMVEDLKEYRDKLLAYSSELETKVSERTAELQDINEQLRVELVEHKKAEEALKRSKEFSEVIFNSMNDAISVIDVHHFKIIDANRIFLDNLGAKKEEVIGKTCHEITHHRSSPCVPPDDICPLLEVLKTGKSSVAEHVHYRKDGEKIYIEVSASPIKDEKGMVFQVIHVVRDITERKRAAERLADSGERYRTLFEGAAEGILVTDIEGLQFKYANPAICRMLGYTIEELTRLGVVDIHPKEALDHVAADFETQARGEMILSPDIPCLRKDGSIIYTSIATAPVVIDGRKCNVGFFTDITERKRAEEALRETEKRFKLAAESSTDLIYEWDIKERVDWFGKIDELLGYFPSEFPRTFEAWANSVHPEDRDRVVAAVKNHLEKNELYNIEYRVMKKDGTYNYWWVRGNAVRDEKGNPYRWVGAITDVTDHKRAEEEREKLIHELQDALGKIKTLSGLLPICASCKKIRDDKGYWSQIEAYIGDHSEAEFTHSICPECMKKLYPDL